MVSSRNKALPATLTELEALCKRTLPDFAHRFLFSHPDQYPVAKLLAVVAFAFVIGLGLFIGLTSHIPMSTVSRWISAYVFLGVCIVGAVVSYYFRCSLLLMVHCMLSSQSKTLIMIFVLYAVYQGPVVNIHRNLQDVTFSMGCNLDLQVEHSKLMWKSLHDPLATVLQNIVDQKDVLQAEARNVSWMFQNITDELLGAYGYDTLDQPLPGTGESTQERFAARTMMQCDAVVEEGMAQCRHWFSSKWEDCMREIQVAVVSHILCSPMQASFICDVMKVMIPWCRQGIPVDENFGKIYDKLSDSINRLRGEFNASVVYKELDQESFFYQEKFTENLSREFEQNMVVLEQILHVFQALLSCTFILSFISACCYVRQYNRDIFFDNMYITTYFRQIDARRRKAGKRHLLPLKKAERSYFINLWSLHMHGSELKCLIRGLFHVVSLGICIALLLVIDWVLYRIFDIIRNHTLAEFLVHSSHHIEFNVGGHSMLANLLRKTVQAFNTSSTLDVKSSNKYCLPQPTALSLEQYLYIFLPLLMMLVMYCSQVYCNRLRRVIATFYFPEREKKRILFLYNLQIQRRIGYINDQRIRLMRRGRPRRTIFPAPFSMFEKLRVKLQCCCVCEDRLGDSEAVRCPASDCGAVYCPQCWKDLGRLCFACIPYVHFGTAVPDDAHNYAE